jgi:hypothetical protein
MQQRLVREGDAKEAAMGKVTMLENREMEVRRRKVGGKRGWRGLCEGSFREFSANFTELPDVPPHRASAPGKTLCRHKQIGSHAWKARW